MNHLFALVAGLLLVTGWAIVGDQQLRAEGCGCHDPRQAGSGPHQTGSSLDHMLHEIYLGRDDLQVMGIPGDQGPITVGHTGATGGGIGSGTGASGGGQGERAGF